MNKNQKNVNKEQNGHRGLIQVNDYGILDLSLSTVKPDNTNSAKIKFQQPYLDTFCQTDIIRLAMIETE